MSKKHPGASKVRRERHDEDVFVESVLESSLWARQHGRILAIGGIVLFLALAAGIYYKNYRSNLENNAAAELTRVRQTVLSGNKQLAASDLKSYVARYGNTESGAEGRAMLAQMHLSLGQPEEAVKAVQPIAGDVEDNPTAALLLGAGYEALKQWDKAEQTYLKIAEKARFGFEKREAYERVATLRLQNGNPAGAIQMYNRALETLPAESVDRQIYEMRIAEIRGGVPAAS